MIAFATPIHAHATNMASLLAHGGSTTLLELGLLALGLGDALVEDVGVLGLRRMLARLN